MDVVESVIVTNHEVMSGTPCFRGTRVPLKNLIDYIERGYPLSEFLEDFPTVSHTMAVQALERGESMADTATRPLNSISSGAIVELAFPGTDAQ